MRAQGEVPAEIAGGAVLRERRLRKEGEGEAADVWGLRVRPLTRGACGSASVRLRSRRARHCGVR